MAEPEEHVQERFTVPPELEGQRADAAVAALTGLSRSAAAVLCAEGRVLHRDRPVAKSFRVETSQTLTVHVPVPEDPARIVPQLVEDFRVVHLDDDIVVIDKPPGVAAHPSPGWKGPTVVGALAGAGVTVSTSGAPERAGVVHRLDVGTSGLMVVARTERAYTALKRAFKDRTVTKVYHTVVQGLPDPLRGTIDAVHLETGRTHQIRVHFSALRHPCCGDLTYGADPALSAGLGLTRQWLHAKRLGFEHPGTGEPVEYESPYPPDLSFALETLRDGGPA